MFEEERGIERLKLCIVTTPISKLILELLGTAKLIIVHYYSR